MKIAIPKTIRWKFVNDGEYLKTKYDELVNIIAENVVSKSGSIFLSEPNYSLVASSSSSNNVKEIRFNNDYVWNVCFDSKLEEDEIVLLAHDKDVPADIQERIQKLKSKIGEMKLKVVFGGETNKIEYKEIVMAINDVTDMLTATLTGHDQLDWLEDQINNFDANCNKWIVENSFSDRQGINERYGFT